MDAKISILLAEDEASLGLLIKEALERKGFIVSWTKNGLDALKLAAEQDFDIAILDVMMPGMDGFQVATQLRKVDKDTRLLFLTARSSVEDVVRGFESGGNDYLKKPFSMEELVVRIRELVRRNQKTQADDGESINTQEFGGYLFNSVTQLLIYGKEERLLTHRESELLQILLSRKNEVVSRKQVLLSLWGDDNFFHARTMDVYIGRLRKYLSAGGKVSILNIRGIGYKLVES